MTLVKFFTSDRTNSNGQIEKDFDHGTYNEYTAWKDKEGKEHLPVPFTILDMDKSALIEYAQDMYQLEFSRKMTAANMVRALYEHVNGTERTRKDKPPRDNALLPDDEESSQY
jgi:hypothetical protein